jgi:phosphoribosyl 1,2-cyclic phosphate phosphodiesterase
MSLDLLFLGTGTSAGVPMIGCKCAVCTSPDPRDKRSRPSVLVGYDDDAAGDDAPPTRQFLIDTTPELRAQCLTHDITRIDGVFYTHAHADHVFGLDDLRRFNAVMGRPVDLYAEPSVIERFRMMFTYIFEPHKNVNPSFIPQLCPMPIDPGRPVERFGGVWTPLRLMHGRLPILGFRVDADGSSLAYCTDVSSIPPATYPLLEGLDVLVIDALRYRHHPTHFTVDQALQQIDQVQPKRAFLTHIAHEVMHAELEPRLPANVRLAYDGLAVECGG